MGKQSVARSVLAAADVLATASKRATTWWQRHWIWVVGLPLGAWCALVLALTWKYAGHPVAEVSEVFSQMQMVITATQAAIAFVVGLAVMYSARTAAESARQARERKLSEAHSARVGRLLAFAGAAVDVAAHGGTLATLQRAGLRRRLPSPRVEEELRVVTWRDLVTASSAAARALQHLRFANDPVLNPAEDLFGTLNEIVRLATEGEVEAVEEQVDLVGGRVREFESFIQRLDPHSPRGR